MKTLVRLLRFALSATLSVVKIVLFLAGAVALAGLTAWVTIERSFETSEVIVPNVIGMGVEEATRRLASEEIGLQVESRAPHETVEEGRIFFQEPPGGGRTRRGRHVKVVLSLGAARTEIPDLSGKSPRGALLLLRPLGLDLGEVVRVHSARVPANQVFAQDPPAGGVVHERARVDVLVSLGQRQVSYVMPRLIGHELARVEVALASVGMRVAEVRQRRVRGAAPGTVQEQLPLAGSRVQSDTPVTLVVAEVLEEPVPAPYGRRRLFAE